MVPSRPASASLFFFFLYSCPCVSVWLGGSRGAGIVDRISARPLLFFLSSLSKKEKRGELPCSFLFVVLRSGSVCHLAGPQVHMASSLLAKPSGVPPDRRWVQSASGHLLAGDGCLPAPGFRPHLLHQLLHRPLFWPQRDPVAFFPQSSPSSSLAPPRSSILGIFRQVNETLPATNLTSQRHGLRRKTVLCMPCIWINCRRDGRRSMPA